jgi:hypothetical protein
VAFARVWTGSRCRWSRRDLHDRAGGAQIDRDVIGARDLLAPRHQLETPSLLQRGQIVDRERLLRNRIVELSRVGDRRVIGEDRREIMNVRRGQLGRQISRNSTLAEPLCLKESASARRELQRNSARGACNKLRSFVKLSCPVAGVPFFRNKMAETPSGCLPIAELANSKLATISDGKLLSNRSSKVPPF